MKAIPVALLVTVLLTLSGLSQNSRAIPPHILHAQELQAQNETAPRSHPSDPFELRNAAQQLAVLAASIPPDIQNANKGLVSKDLIHKLKEIEKLSKHLRSELRQ